MAKPEFKLWADTLIDISNENNLDTHEKLSLRQIAKELMKFQDIVEVTKEQNHG